MPARARVFWSLTALLTNPLAPRRCDIPLLLCSSQLSLKASASVVAKPVSTCILLRFATSSFMLFRACSTPPMVSSRLPFEPCNADMEYTACSRAGESWASGHTSVRHGFSEGPSLTERIPQVWRSKCCKSTSGEVGFIQGCEYMTKSEESDDDEESEANGDPGRRTQQLEMV